MTHAIGLVTGGNKGIGLEIARQLGRQGIAILLGARDLVRGEAAVQQLREEGIKAEAVELDMTQSEHIERVFRTIEEKYGRLDILVNNADAFFDHLGSSADMLRQSFEVNCIGPFALTQAVLPLLRRSPRGRIVNQSSILGSMGTILTDAMYGQASAPGYTASKAALNAWTAQLSIALQGTNVKVNACHPGWVKTDMGGEAAPMEIEDGAATAVRLATLPDDGPSGRFFHLAEELPW
jgi:NAD(P)-dependent dehydrogenase (short-subunit alcohol dehydrogenase family)